MKLIILIFMSLVNTLTVLAQTKVLVIDPGHNHQDIASGYKTETEVVTNWEVATRLREFINNLDLYWDVQLTRDQYDPGYIIDLYNRKLFANSLEDDFPGKIYFLSIHKEIEPTTCPSALY